MAVVFITIEVKHEQLDLSPLSVCVFDGVSPEQILGCCLFLRLFQGKLSTGEIGRGKRSDKWCLCVQ